ncbi:hypothetical protein [Leptospira sp. GIMC2001]|uniref:hypothetical protein n=1 Tax=Leptospira sp. GIMC2001 TaxID=1513297 RepID=UPI00234905E4|nr:hypothetical protein [Leptospira sp. GIMC2001]WCL48959.1 hypothetical protein O4O04_16930 [Leptospira sp. GIMC2001]
MILIKNFFPFLFSQKIYHFLILLILTVFLATGSVFGQESNLPKAKEFLDMKLDDAYPLIERLNKEDAKELITQIRNEAKKDYSNIDKFYFLISHLEEIQAIEKEQNRLNNLLWVYGLGFILFTGFLGYILHNQRKAIRDIQRSIK